MNWKKWFSRKAFIKRTDRYQRLDESILSVRIIAIVLVTVFIPSILITVLGIVAVYRAEPILRQWIEAPIQNLLFQLDQKLIKEWDNRLLRYGSRLNAEQNLHRYLLNLSLQDDHIQDVILHENGEFQRIEEESPFWRLEAPLDDADLTRAWKYEFQDQDPAGAMTVYQGLIENERAPPEIEVEALTGYSRVLIALGKTREAIEVLQKLIDRYGQTEDGSGLPRGLPALWRLIKIHQESGDLVNAATAARQLIRYLDHYAPWLDEGLLQRYRELLDIYKRETKDVSLTRDLGPSEIHSPISTLILNEDHRRNLLEHIESEREGETSGYLTLPTEGEETICLVFFRLKIPERKVYFILDPAAYLEDVRLFTSELQIPDHLLLIKDQQGKPFTKKPDRETEPLVSRPFPRPFQHLRMHYFPTPDQIPRQLRNLETLEAMGFIWALIVLVLTILLGVMITVRSILQEMQVSKLKSDFVSFVSHELKTPLTAIRMITETMLMGRAEDPEEEKKCVEIIDKEASRLSRLIEQILEFSRIEKQQQVFNFTSCDMSEVVREAVKIYKGQNADENYEIVINQAQHISKIRMDRSAMIELLLNLLSNAHKYSRSSDKKIVINLKESIDDILVEVIDYGVGIPKREQKKIFDKFYRAQDYLTRDVEGTGLGLTFAKYIANVHNGEIKVSSVVNQGSTFTLELRKNQILGE